MDSQTDDLKCEFNKQLCNIREMIRDQNLRQSMSSRETAKKISLQNKEVNDKFNSLANHLT